MAKAIIMGGGGGGTTSDELTAKREDVLKGKTAVTSDSNDEAGMGTLELTGNAAAGNVKKGETFYTTDPKSKQTGTLEEKTGQYAAASSLDTGNKRVRLDVPGRAIYGDSALLYDTFANIASRIGLTAAKLAQGQSVLGVTGTYKGRGNATQGHVRKGIYFSSASLDNAVGTMAEKGAQTFTPGRSNQSVGANQFLTGAQTILGDANLLAANIKKGARIFGVTGTFEGYVPTAQDWYVRGNNIKGFSAVTNNGGPTFLSDCIASGSDNDMGLYIKAGSYTRPGGITKLNIQCDIWPGASLPNGKGHCNVYLYDGYAISSRKRLASVSIETTNTGTPYKGTISLDISNISSISLIAISVELVSSKNVSKIYRIWVS